MTQSLRGKLIIYITEKPADIHLRGHFLKGNQIHDYFWKERLKIKINVLHRSGKSVL